MPAQTLSILEGPNMTVLNSSGADIPAYRLVKIAGAGSSYNNTVSLAGINDPPLGITKAIIKDGARGLVRLVNAPGTQIGTASATEAIAAGDVLYQAANGKVTKTATTKNFLGLSRGAAAADGDLVEFVVTPPPVHA